MNRRWSNLLRMTTVSAVVCLGSSPIFGQTEGDLKRAFEGKMVSPRMDMPDSPGSIRINFKNPQPRDFKTEQQDLAKAQYRRRVPAGATRMVTEIRANGDTIELSLGKGVMTQRPCSGSGSRGVPQRSIQRGTVPESGRARGGGPVAVEPQRSEAPLTEEQAGCIEENRKLREGAIASSKFTIQYRAKLTPADLTPEAFRKVMDEYIDFAPSTAGATVKSAPVSGPSKQAEESAKQQVVMIKGTIDGDDTVGAGLIVGSAQDRLYIVTANHVVRKGRAESKDLQVMLNWLNGSWFKADLLSTLDAKSDLAVITVFDLRKMQFDASTFTFGRVGAALQRAERVRFVGYGNTEPWHESVDPAPVSLVSTESIKFQSAFLVPGDSGGVLFNEQWQVVGMNQSDQQGEAQAIPFGKIQEKLKEWRHPVNLK